MYGKDSDRFRLFFGRFFGEFCRNQIFIFRTVSKLAGFIQNIQKQCVSVFSEDHIRLPCILGLVAIYNGSDRSFVCVRKLWRNGRCNLFAGMFFYILHSLLQRVCKGLDDVWIFLDIAFFCRKGGIRHIAGVYAKRCYDIAGFFCFKCGCGRLKFYSIWLITAPLF